MVVAGEEGGAVAHDPDDGRAALLHADDDLVGEQGLDGHALEQGGFFGEAGLDGGGVYLEYVEALHAGYLVGLVIGQGLAADYGDGGHYVFGGGGERDDGGEDEGQAHEGEEATAANIF